jgi:hypothetical protein
VRAERAPSRPGIVPVRRDNRGLEGVAQLAPNRRTVTENARGAMQSKSATVHRRPRHLSPLGFDRIGLVFPLS